jgi:hypothetical protein
MLVGKSYNNIVSLFWLAVSAEKEILLSVNTCKNDEAHNVENLTAINVIQEHETVEPIADFSLSEDELHVVPCDKEKLYVDASFIPMPQVVNKSDTSSQIAAPLLELEHSLFPLVVHNILQEEKKNIFECIQQCEQQHAPQKCEKNDCAAPAMSKVSQQSNKLNAEISPCEYDHASLVSTTHLVHGDDDSILDYTHADTRRVHCITSEKEEFEIISSSNCLGYIEFDFLCDLKSLVNKLYDKSDLPSFNHCLLHAIGKYDSEIQYLVHRIYICSDLKSPFGLHDHDKIGGCTNANNVSQSPSRFSLKQQGHPKEGEHCWFSLCSIQVALCPNIEASTFRCHRNKSRTTCSQEGENDEDITVSDMTTIACFYYKVNRFLIIIVSNTFDELLLHYDVCWLSFSEILTWIKKGAQHTWKAWRTKEVDWGPSPSVPHVLHQATTSLLAQRWKEIKANTFWTLDSDCTTRQSCNGCHDLIRSPFGTFFIWLER